MKGYKTIILAVLQVIAGILAISTDTITVLPEDAGIPLILSGIAFAILRFFTNTNIFKSS